MTRNFLITATALTALAFAGAANAGTITNSRISDVNINDGTANALRVFTIASETTNPTVAAPLLSTAATTRFNVDLTNDLTIANGQSTSYEISFNLTGSGRFGTVAQSNLQVFGTIGAQSNAQLTAGVTVQNISPADGSSARFLVTVTGQAGGDESGTAITDVRLNGVELRVTGEGDVSLGSIVRQAVGSAFVDVDTTAATKIVQFKAALGSYTGTAQTVLAGLPSFTAFKAQSGANAVPAASLTNPLSGSTTLFRTVTTATAGSNVGGFSVSLATAGTDQVGGSFFQNLVPAVSGNVGTGLTLANIISGASVVVSGTNLDKLTPRLSDVSATAGSTLTATSATFALTGAAALSGQFSLTAPTASPPVLTAGTYVAAITPTYQTGFTPAPTSATNVNLLTVSLDGTTFNAPWFTLNNPNNSATLRIGNNSSTTATGPVIVQLRANNGTSTTTPMVTIAQSIAANSTLDITTAELATALGTNAQNGDLLVTVQGDGSVLSAKVRVRNVSGATFEQSLGLLQ